MPITPSMSTTRRGWLPREGFTADVVQAIVTKTILNPTLTLPLFLLSRYTDKGQAFALDHSTAVSRLKICLYLGVARYINGILNRGALDNWQSAKFDWNKELVVITGGSDGFGKLLVHMFAAKNVKVVVLDVQKPTYELPNANVHFLQLDLSIPEDITSVSKTLIRTHGHPTVLVLNAGLANGHSILETPDKLMTRMFAVNTLCHYRLAREFLPDMVSQNHGMVVTVASLAAFVTPAGLVDYCASKAAALSFHEGLATELRDRYNAPKIRTICVCPNFAATKLAAGMNNQSNFLSPTLHPETVVEAIFAKMMTGTSGCVVVPRTSEWLAMTVRALPFWWQGLISRGLKDVMRPVEIVQRERLRAEREREMEREKEGNERALGDD